MKKGTTTAPVVMIVDDEQRTLEGLAILMRHRGFKQVVTESDPRRVMPMLAERSFACVLLDLMMPHISGDELLPQILAEYPELPVIVVTGNDTVDTAVRCIKHGAFDFIVKPVDSDRLLTSVRNAVGAIQLERENRRLHDYMLSNQLEQPDAFKDIITRSPLLIKIFQYIEAVAVTSYPVCVTGETGVGKEMISRATHVVSGREGPFVPVNAAGLDENMFSDTLFGHLKGAFTGADRDREGLVARAAGGTLFLDEIGDLGPNAQVKLLRLLQEGEFMSVGDDTVRHVDARIIVATNRNLHDLQARGKFRMDLYYRLAAHHISIPPLRERREDVPLLIAHFIEQHAKKQGKRASAVPHKLLDLLRQYPFPGNVRELQAIIMDAVTRTRSGRLSLNAVREKIAVVHALAETEDTMSLAESNGMVFPPILPSIKEATTALIQEAIHRAGGNQTMAARMLGITQQALSQRLAKIRKPGRGAGCRVQDAGGRR